MLLGNNTRSFEILQPEQGRKELQWIKNTPPHCLNKNAKLGVFLLEYKYM
jgi:hypothetical protein